MDRIGTGDCRMSRRLSIVCTSPALAGPFVMCLRTEGKSRIAAGVVACFSLRDSIITVHELLSGMP